MKRNEFYDAATAATAIHFHIKIKQAVKANEKVVHSTVAQVNAVSANKGRLLRKFEPFEFTELHGKILKCKAIPIPWRKLHPDFIIS